MKRREFITLLGGAAAAWPLGARAQQPRRITRIGFVAGGARPVPFETGPYVGFLQGMRELGYVEGSDFVVEWRFAEGNYDRFSDFAVEFAQLGLDVIVTGLGLPIPAMRQANPNTPIVLGYGLDPVGQGYVTSLARPGGNTTGLASAIDDIISKQVGLLITVVPNLSRLAILTNPANPAYQSRFRISVEDAVQQGRVRVVLLETQNAQEIESAFHTLTNEPVEAIVVVPDALFLSQRLRIAELATKGRLPSMFGNREYVQAGGLMSYGDSIQDFYRRAASYVSKIIKGSKPADLPVEQPTSFRLVINRKTADTIGLSIAAQLYLLADEVIE